MGGSLVQDGWSVVYDLLIDMLGFLYCPRSGPSQLEHCLHYIPNSILCRARANTYFWAARLLPASPLLWFTGIPQVSSASWRAWPDSHLSSYFGFSLSSSCSLKELDSSSNFVFFFSEEWIGRFPSLLEFLYLFLELVLTFSQRKIRIEWKAV